MSVKGSCGRLCLAWKDDISVTLSTFSKKSYFGWIGQIIFQLLSKIVFKVSINLFRLYYGEQA